MENDVLLYRRAKVKAIRIFESKDGWVAVYEEVSKRF
jgi:cupin superfamily acireductone dioxygenase involved in methionine salvage